VKPEAESDLNSKSCIKIKKDDLKRSYLIKSNSSPVKEISPKLKTVFGLGSKEKWKVSFNQNKSSISNNTDLKRADS
jgi:DNA-binding MltR family transcriptional regulator